jgi:Holliday junction resolvase RusA-like endonuclease
MVSNTGSEIFIRVMGRPIPYVRMTRRSKFKDPRAIDYEAYLDIISAVCMFIRPRPLPWQKFGMIVRVYIKNIDGVRGDFDNYLKAAADGLQKAGVYKNDKSVIDGLVSVRSGEPERMEILIFDNTEMRHDTIVDHWIRLCLEGSNENQKIHI